MAGGIYPDIGTGASLALATSAWAPQISEMNWGGIDRDMVESTHLATTTARSYLPADLYDPGELNLSVFYEPGNEPPTNGALETVTLTFPLNTAQGVAVAATLAGSAAMTSFSFSVPLEDMITADVSFKFSGVLTWTSATS